MDSDNFKAGMFGMFVRNVRNIRERNLLDGGMFVVEGSVRAYHEHS